MENEQIILKNLFKDYPIGKGRTFTALHDINLKFAAGEFTGIVGPSGSGKTTMLNIIGSLDSPSKGSAQVLGLKIEDLGSKAAADLRNKNLGFIFQTYNLLSVYSVYENVEFPLLLLGLAANKRKKMVMDALEWVGLTEKIKSKPNRLSGGECQRVAIARAVVKNPSMVLADEPTANLDAANSHNILQVMEKLNKELGTTFLFSTHDEKVIAYLKRKITLEDGRVSLDEKM